MTTGDPPAFDDLERGHVDLAPDSFGKDDDATRPWVVANRPTHPFHGQQYLVLTLTKRTWYDERVPLSDDDYVHRAAPEESAIVPHAPASLQPRLATDYVCRVQADPVDRVVELLYKYL